MAIAPDTASFAAIGTTRDDAIIENGANDSNSCPMDVTNLFRRHRFLRHRLRNDHTSKNKKNDLRVTSNVHLRQKRRRKLRHQRQHYQQEKLPHQDQCWKEEHLSNTCNRYINDNNNSLEKVVEEEREQKPVENVDNVGNEMGSRSNDSRHPSMPSPKHEMTDLVLLQRQNRLNDLRFQLLDVPVAVAGREERENEGEVIDPSQTHHRPIAYNKPSNNSTPAAVIADINEGLPTVTTCTTAMNGVTSPCTPDGYHFTDLPDGTPVYSSLSPFCNMSIGHDEDDNRDATIRNCVEEEEEKELQSWTQSQSLSLPQRSLHTIDDNQKGILFVGMSSIGPLAQSSSMISTKEVTKSEANVDDYSDDQYHSSSASDDDMHQNDKDVTMTDCDNDVENSGLASTSVVNALASSISSIAITTDTNLENSNGDDYEVDTLQHEKKRKNGKDSISSQKQRCNDDDLVVEDLELEEDAKKKKSRNENTTRFTDIIGHQSVKLRLDEVLLPLALPASLSRTILRGIRSLPTSILMYGPPGCGKTQLAKAVAGEANAAFLSIGPSDVLSKYVGESEEAIRSLFAEAVRLARNNKGGSRCTVLFFDEIDALGQSRGVSNNSNGVAGGGGKAGPSAGGSEQSGGGGDNSSRRILAELLIQLTKINSIHGTYDSSLFTESEEEEKDNEESRLNSREEENIDGSYNDGNLVFSDDPVFCRDEKIQEEGKLKREHNEIESNLTNNDNRSVKVIVVAATNRPEDCDPALIRRFAVQVQVALPTGKDRGKMLKRSMEDIEHTITKKQFSDLSLITNGWSGSDIQSLAREAVMAPVRECIRRAALLKRRRFLSNPHRGKKKIGDDIVAQTHRGEQKNGESDNDNESSNTNESQKKNDARDDDYFTGSQKRLLEEFRNLRPVNFRDYTKALTFRFSRMFNNLYDSPLAEFGWIEEGEGRRDIDGNGVFNEHYDSSSDEDDELDVISTEGIR